MPSQPVLTLGFAGAAGGMRLRFVGAYPFDDTFEATDDATGFMVFESSNDQLEEKKVRLEFITGEGKKIVIWAENVELLE